MSARAQTSDLRSIRSWNGSQDTAFEELCYQLLREPGDLPSPDAIPVRTGNPDGGVEWYVDLSDGSQWGWQAKYIRAVGPLLGAMQKTVERVVLERPNLTRLTFCIPSNLSAGTSGGQRKSARQRYSDAVQEWRTRILGASQIDFVLLGESELLERLSKPQHAGRRQFWFNEEYLGMDSLERLYNEARDYAGDRYRPQLQVDLPIESDLQALGFADSYFEELDHYRVDLIQNLRWTGRLGSEYGAEISRAFDDAIAAAQVLRVHMSAATYEAGSVNPIAQLFVETETAQGALSRVSALVYEFGAAASQSSDATKKKLADELRNDSYPARRLLDSVNSLHEYLVTPASEAVRSRAYFLTGDAGSGKTHLLLDSVHKALRDERPSAVIFGSRFGDGNIWHTIGEQLGLPLSGRDEILGAMSACAEASSHQGRRFVLAIDALNETPEPSFWARHLASVIASAASWPHVAIAVSCRSSYLAAVDPERRRESQFVMRTHPGFAGREVEATQKYFEHYRLPEPRIPLLLPEFTVPLFLQFYCESWAGQPQPADRHEGRVETFSRFLRTKVDRVATRLRPNAALLEREEVIADVEQGLRIVLRECVDTGREWIMRERVGSAGTHFQSSSGITWIQVINGLEVEGVLTVDRVYTEGSMGSVLRVTFQAFADYLLLRERLDLATNVDVAKDAIFKNWLVNASYGILEAAAVVLPELFGIELVDYLGETKRSGESRDNRRTAKAGYEDMICRTLPYRAATAVSDRTVEILNDWPRTWDHGNSFFNVLFLLSPQPGHRLNGAGLHRYLTRMSMPERDAWFGRQTYHDLTEGNSAVARLARWSARGPYPSYDTEIVELASIPLIWMLGSPNRFSRDWITKALIQLMRGHPDVLLKLLARFRTVNDPYIWERLVTVAYGAAMRATPGETPKFAALVTFIRNQLFRKLDEFVPDALMLDAARGLVEWGVVNGLLTDNAAKVARPPYAIGAPSIPWTKKRIEERYAKSNPNRPVEDSYTSIYWSVMSYGDFGKYVIEPGLHHFSKVPLTRKRPTREDRAGRDAVVDRRGLSRFIKALSETQLQHFGAVADDGMTSEVREQALKNFRSSLTPAQRRLLIGTTKRLPQAKYGDTQYPAERGERWIFQRVLSLGWNPKRFGQFDSGRRYGDSGRSAHKAERFGKKYQWIAYHELLARVANNFHVDPWSWGSETFDGMHELNDREIDPSLPPVHFESRDDDEPTFDTLPVHLTTPSSVSPDFREFRHQPKRFVQGEGGLPTAELVSTCEDESGVSWTVVDATLNSFDPETDDPGEYRGLEQWCHVHSWLVPGDTADRATTLLLKAVVDLMSEVLDTHGHSQCCYLGELGWRNVTCYHHHLRPVQVADPEGSDLAVYFTAEDYSWEGGGYDCSINRRVSVSAPSAFLLRAGNVRWNGEQPIWLDGTQQVAAFVGRRGLHDKSLLVIRKDWLLALLERHGLSLVTIVRGERRRIAGEASYREPWLAFSSAVSIDAKGNFTNQQARRNVNPGQLEQVDTSSDDAGH